MHTVGRSKVNCDRSRRTSQLHVSILIVYTTAIDLAASTLSSSAYTCRTFTVMRDHFNRYSDLAAVNMRSIKGHGYRSRRQLGHGDRSRR